MKEKATPEGEEMELSSSSSQEWSSSSSQRSVNVDEQSSASTISSQKHQTREWMLCFTFLVGIVFAAGVAMVVLSVTLFHQQGQWHAQNGQQQHKSSREPKRSTPTNPEDQDEDEEGFYYQLPSRLPTLPPSIYTTGLPTIGPTVVPTMLYEGTTATFYAIGDVPYNDRQASQLAIQMQNIPTSTDFVIHVGDLRNASDSLPCRLDEFERASSILKLSPVPVFVVMGDNDWNDCPNYDEGLQYWKEEFLFFESRFWNHTFNITRQPGRDESFTFRFRGTLFIGLNLVGGKVLDEGEWQLRLRSQFNWTADLIREYRDDISPNTGRVVLFGHANPTKHHSGFFNPLRDFVQDELRDTLPLLYLNGDQHKWRYEDNYLSQSYMLRIMVTGGSSEPPLKVTVNANGSLRPVDESFVYDRDLTNTSLWKRIPS
jgi:Calcineurin-like phosphoesterase